MLKLNSRETHVYPNKHRPACTVCPTVFVCHAAANKIRLEHTWACVTASGRLHLSACTAGVASSVVKQQSIIIVYGVLCMLPVKF